MFALALGRANEVSCEAMSVSGTLDIATTAVVEPAETERWERPNNYFPDEFLHDKKKTETIIKIRT